MFEDRLPTKTFDVVKTGATHLTIEIEPREVRFSDNPSLAPKANNAWRYVREGSRDDRGGVLDAALGPIINVWRGEVLRIKWVNHIGSAANPDGAPVLATPPVNPIDMMFPNEQWNKMNPSIGVVTHLHGAKVESGSDGWPLEPASFLGNPYGRPTRLDYTYANDQRSAMLWFHDHAMDNTSPQVHAGLAGIYFVRDASDQKILDLIGGASQEIPLVIQDRKFDCGLQNVDFWAGVPTEVDPNDATKRVFTRAEFLGETIFVNGRPTPFVEVSNAIYRLRVLNGSNARSYALALVDPSSWSSMSAIMGAMAPKVWHSDRLIAIGNDGGLFPEKHVLGATDHILLAPGERLDLLLDLTGIDPSVVSRLRLVNLAVASAQAGDWPEAIFQCSAEQTFTSFPGQPVGSSLIALPVDETDNKPLAALHAIGAANLLELCISGAATPVGMLDTAKLDAILLEKATEDGFVWANGALGLPAGAKPAANRFVVLMNDTKKLGQNVSPVKNDYTGEGWRDTQIWELTTVPGANAPFEIPFDVDLTSAAPAQGRALAAGEPSVKYYVTRSSFFKTYPAKKRIDKDLVYEDLPPSALVYQPKAGTYERWYVANLTNEQAPFRGASEDPDTKGPNVPDMHPFHMHLVNFVVQRRWRVSGEPGVFEEMVDKASGKRDLDLDGVCRHDTVRVQSNELLELLVYFPPGYKGLYPYHCHIVEHEDMGMMSHCEVAD